MFDSRRVFSGYDSDVAREKVVDYVTKIYSASIRNMSGTRPHLQLKELPVEERCFHTHTHTHSPLSERVLTRFPIQASCESSGSAA